MTFPFLKSLPRPQQALPLPRVWLVLLILLLASSGHDDLDDLARIQARGHLIMLTVNGATTYYLGAEGETGFEYELAQAFADDLGVALEVVTLSNPAELMQALINGQGDFIAAGIPRQDDHDLLLSGPTYQVLTPTVVYRRGTPRPSGLDELSGHVELIDGKGFESLLTPSSERPASALTWQVRDDASIEDLFDAITKERIDYTIADSNVVELNRRFFPAIGQAFEFDQQIELAWLTRRSTGHDLMTAMNTFFQDLEDSDQLTAIQARHFEIESDYEPAGTFTFMRQVEERLPALQPLFIEAADQVGLDWALLAAVGYQESHWNPKAVSPTGVRGVMMLTQRTAAQLGVTNRLDPTQSIMGGARYLKSMLDRLPERIEMPDRLWLALAAYNIGLGHLEDARVITQRQGGNPDRWLDVRDHLPLLTQERWYRQTRFGYARGYEAVNYVSNIRTFYEILLWMDQRGHPLITRQSSPVQPDADPRTLLD